MKIIITGASGFLGAEVAGQCLEQGHTPVLLVRKDSDSKRLKQFENLQCFVYEDLMEAGLIAELQAMRPDCFIHLGWKGVDRDTRNQEEQVTYNLPFSLDTVKLANTVNCKQWVGIGSLTEYGILHNKIDENYPPHPHTIYAKSKLATCWASAAMCQSFGIEWSWIRVGAVFGPGDNEQWLIPYVIQSILKKKSPQLTPSEQVWDYLYVSDAAKAILSVACKSATGIFNLGSGQAQTVKHIVETIAAKIDNGTIAQIGAIPYSENQIMHLESGIEKIIAATGWVPEITFSEGLDRTIAAFKN